MIECVCFAGTHCGIGAVPQALVSAGETLDVSFSSNNRIVDTGFMAHYEVVDPSAVEGESNSPMLTLCLNEYTEERTTAFANEACM